VEFWQITPGWLATVGPMTHGRVTLTTKHGVLMGPVYVPPALTAQSPAMVAA
jgi:hypothetical protein